MLIIIIQNALVAQLDRAPDFGSGGSGILYVKIAGAPYFFFYSPILINVPLFFAALNE